MNKKMDMAMLGVIFGLAWPTMLEQFMQTAVQYIDTAMVGSLGTAATASVGATSTVNWLVMGVVNAIGVGFLAIIAQAFGSGNKEVAKKVSAQAFTLTGIVGILLTILMVSISKMVPVWMQVDESILDTAGTYFMIIYCPMLFRCATIIFGTLHRAVGDTKTPMKVGIIVNLVNIVLNFLFIYPSRTIYGIHVPGTNWGVIGAGIASAISFAVGGILITISLWRHKEISPKGYSFKPNWEILKPCIKIAIPNMFQRFGTSLGYVVFASMINALGGVATAAHTIANTVESAFYIPGWGMQAAAATLAGNALGAKDHERLDRLAKTIIPLEVGLMIISGGMLFIFAKPLVMIFSKSSEVITLGTTVLRMVAVSEPFYGVPIVVEGLMQGLGETKVPLVYNVLGMWSVRIVGTFICTKFLGMGLVSAWACMIGHNLLLFFLFGYRYISGKWNPMNRKEKLVS